MGYIRSRCPLFPLELTTLKPTSRLPLRDLNTAFTTLQWEAQPVNMFWVLFLQYGTKDLQLTVSFNKGCFGANCYVC